MTYSILVTGSNSGFGRRMTETLASAGHQVFAAMRQAQGKNVDASRELQEWAAARKLDLHVLELDVTDDSSVRHAVQQMLERAKRIDVLINNAGVGLAGVVEAFTIEQAQTLFNVNVFGPLRLNKAVLPQMRSQKSGLIIQISSTFGRLSMPFSGLYSASKFAVEAFAEAAYYELAPFGVESVLVEPGPFPTELGGKIMFPEDEKVAQEYAAVNDGGQKLGETLGEFFSGPNALDPQAVADAVNTVINTPPGERPLRTVVDPLSPKQIGTVNEAAARVQPEFMQAFGV